MSLAIDTEHLRKEYGAKVAVSDLTLQVQEGEVFGFLGPNGAGKTTSVKMLLSLISPTSGAARILGRPLGDLGARARVGYLPEHFRFHDWLRAAEFLDLHGKLYGMSAGERAAVIPDLLELVGLSDQAQVKVGTFSKGMQQRIGLAQALLNNPRIVFLDEPTSGLDPLGRKLVRDIINRLREEGVTVFLNSHLLSEVELTCDRVAFIRKGVVVQTTTIEDWHQENVQLALRVGQPDEALREGLAAWGTVMPALPADKLTGRIRLAISHESRIPALAQWLHEHQYSLYELTPLHLSLEERFIQLMGGEAVA
ncbi:MAG: ABC transporter ATP-binding protein [Anaerolineales bacterium]|nr:ABC transporter ATP-binding protein [Anaerolineales bacterium]MCB8953183.1 ABC transporter ATP-binding protein [Ardenticatenales bacterium]